MKKKVALALASGGPRGFAYIGAIEELLGRGQERIYVLVNYTALYSTHNILKAMEKSGQI